MWETVKPACGAMSSNCGTEEVGEEPGLRDGTEADWATAKVVTSRANHEQSWIRISRKCVDYSPRFFPGLTARLPRDRGFEYG